MLTLTLLLAACDKGGEDSAAALIGKEQFIAEFSAAQCVRLEECDNEDFYVVFGDLETCEASQTRWNKQTRKYRRRSGCVVAKSAIVQVNHLLRPRFFMSYLSRPSLPRRCFASFCESPQIHGRKLCHRRWF